MSIDELAEAAKRVSDRINEVADAAEDAARFREVRATIYVNAIHGLGCTEEEATAYADGTSEKTFVQALIERFDGVNATDQAERIKELESSSFGYVYHNPDTGVEWGEQHPIESGEVPDATDIQAADLAVLHSNLMLAWQENGILHTEKHADAEAIGALRDDLDRLRSDRPFVTGWNEGFEHGVKEALRTLHEQWRENSAVKEAAIHALIEGDKP